MTNTAAMIGEWAPGDAAPEFNARISQPRHASYNADGTRVAIHTWVKDRSYVIDSAAGDDPIYIQEDVSSGAWHQTNPDLLAWTEHSDRSGAVDETILKVADVSGYTNTGLEALFEVSLGGGAPQLRAWGDWGFAANVGDTTFVYDADGEQLWGADGEFFDATPDGVLLLASFQDEALLPYLLNPDGTRTELTGLDIGAADLRLTSDGAWVLATTYQADGHTSILARTVHSRSTRLTSIDETARIVDVVGDDHFIVLQEVHSKDLVFKNWNTGAEFRVPIDVEVAAVDF